MNDIATSFLTLGLALARAVPAVAAAPPAQPAVYHVTPEGAGRKDGTHWDHAADAPALATLVNETMKPGDEVLLGGGQYKGVTLTITSGGEAGRPKRLTGVDRGKGLPVLENEWSVDAPDKGVTAVKIGAGVSHLTVSRLRLRGAVTGVLAEPGGGKDARVHLNFLDVDVEQMRHGFYLSDCDDLRLEDCDLKRYTKHGFRFEQGCDTVSVQRCTADCSEADETWEQKTELLPFGFLVNGGGSPNKGFAFEDCLARNNLMPLQKNRYKNGDGFVVEGTAEHVTFARCRSLRNQDGGFDLKTPDVRLRDCVATGNGRGFRIWKTGTLENCMAGWGATALWSGGGSVNVKRSTFHSLTDTAVLLEDGATATLDQCIISGVREVYRSEGGKFTMNNTAVEAEPDAHPDYVKADPAWDGLGDAMNSRTWPEKGYRGAEVAASPGEKQEEP